MKANYLLLLSLFLCFYSTSLYAQEANTWLFADQSGINFNTNPPSYLSNPNRIFNSTTFTEDGGGGATISDNTGNLLFYTSGQKIWDRNHNLMLGGNLEGNFDDGTNNAIIVKQPENNFIYYVFTFNINLIDLTVFPAVVESRNFYHIVDMSRNGGLGEVISKNNILENVVKGGNSVFSATSHCNRRDIWVLSHDFSTQTLSSHLITPTGLQTFAYSAICEAGQGGQIKFSPDGTRLFVTSGRTTDRLLDFDASTGIFSNPEILYTNPSGTVYDFNSQGSEFSPDGTKLYVGQNRFFTPPHIPSGNSYQRRLLQYDMEASDITASQTVVFDFPFEPATPPFPGERPISSTLGIGALQLAPNGTIYIAHQWFGTLSEIRNPNGSVVTCDFVQYGFQLLGTDYLHPASGDLPTFPTMVLFPPISKPSLTDVNGCGVSTLDAGIGYDTYTWTLPNATTATGQTLVANQAGTYILEVTKNCFSAKDTIEVSFIDPPTLDLGLDKEICAGSSTVLNAPNGFSSYTWTLPNATTSTLQNITATEAGTYSLVVTNSCGTATDNIDILISPLPTLDLGLDKQICAGSSTILNAPSGFSSYTWTLPNSTTSTLQNITATEAGTYSLLVTNSCGTATDNIDIIVSPLPTVDLGLDKEICAGTSTVLTAPNGFSSYTWTLPNSTTSTLQNIIATEAGTYSLIITNSCGTATSTIDVLISPLPTLDLGLDKEICAGSSTVLNAPNGFSSYTWTLPNSTTSTLQNLTATEAGTYSLSVTNSCGTATDNIDVVISPLSTVDLGLDKEICAGSSTVLTAPNGFSSYTWTLPNATTSTLQNITATEAGTYSLLVTNSCGTATDNINILVSPLPTVDLGLDKQICAGTSTILNAPNGFSSYTWLLPNNSVSNLQNLTVTENGIYKLTVTTSCGSATDEIVVNVAPNPILNLGNDVFTCENDTTLKAPLGFSSYNWTFPNGTTSTNPTITANQEGNYILKVENNCGIARDTIAVSFKQKPTLDLGIDTLLCQNENITISLRTTYHYVWFDNDTSKVRSFSIAGIYYFDIINECGAKRDSIIINNFVEPVFDLGEDKILCEDETIVLSVNNLTNFPVLWNTGDTTNSIEINKKGTYSVQLFSTCQILVDSIQINYKNKPNLTPIKDAILCQNENYFVEIDSSKIGQNIVWHDGNTNFSRFLRGTGTYFYTLSNECGSVSDTFSIILPPNEAINIDLGEDKILCNGESTLLSAANEVAGLTYLWSTGDTTSEITVNTAGIYVITVSNLCTSKSDTIKIDYLTEINTKINITQKDCSETILNVDLKEDETIKWNNGSTENNFVPTKFGIYEATVSNECESKVYSIEVEIINFEQAFPNVITPNDDGFNDAYILPFENAQIFVYDRWEKLVYRNDNYKNDWSPKNLTGGVYYLLIKHPCLDGSKKIVLSILD